FDLEDVGSETREVHAEIGTRPEDPEIEDAEACEGQGARVAAPPADGGLGPLRPGGAPDRVAVLVETRRRRAEPRRRAGEPVGEARTEAAELLVADEEGPLDELRQARERLAVPDRDRRDAKRLAEGDDLLDRVLVEPRLDLREELGF